MREEMGKDADGWVTIATLLTFNRMKAMTEDEAVVVSALKTPHVGTEESVEVSEDGKRVRRKVPFVELTDEQVAQLNSRTIHFKGITQDATLDEIKSFCSQYGKVVSVEMRRFRDDRKFKVSCADCADCPASYAHSYFASPFGLGTHTGMRDVRVRDERRGGQSGGRDRSL